MGLVQRRLLCESAQPQASHVALLLVPCRLYGFCWRKGPYDSTGTAGWVWISVWRAPTSTWLLGAADP